MNRRSFLSVLVVAPVASCGPTPALAEPVLWDGEYVDLAEVDVRFFAVEDLPSHRHTFIGRAMADASTDFPWKEQGYRILWDGEYFAVAPFEDHRGGNMAVDIPKMRAAFLKGNA